MSERKRAQESERRLLAEKSRRQVAEARSAAVQLERERLEEADRRKDQFLATLAHELRNPLAFVVTAVVTLPCLPRPSYCAFTSVTVSLSRPVSYLPSRTF